MANDKNQSQSSTEGKATVARRTFLKIAASAATVAAPSVAGIRAMSTPVKADVNDHTVEIDEGGTFSERTVGGKIETFKLNGDTMFKIAWDDMVPGDIIEMELLVKLDTINGATATTESGDVMKYAQIGRMGVQVPSESGSKMVPGSDFFENRSSIPITEHPDIDISQFNVDLENNTGDYTKNIEFSVKLIGDAPNDSHRFERIWTYEMAVEAALGFGLVFGEAFGVGN